MSTNTRAPSSLADNYSLQDLLYLMQRLRHSDYGCPWDLAQTYSSLMPYTLEETYEVLAAITAEDWSGVEEELGDLLLQVIFYAQLGAEDQKFNFASIVQRLVTKLIRRHPHIFPTGDLYAPATHKVTQEEAAAAWQAIKQEEAQQDTTNQTSQLLAQVPDGLPAILRAEKLQAAAAKVGFDWPDVQGVLDKIDEEVAELKAEVAQGNLAASQAELGDVIFSLVNLARHLNLDVEAAIAGTNQRFTQRFNRVEAEITANQGWQAATLEELEAAYQRAKRDLKSDES